jgi:hypothetical protein
VSTWNGSVVLVERNQVNGYLSASALRVPGGGWRSLEPAEEEELRTAEFTPWTSSCLTGAQVRCYRVVPGQLAIEESIGGGWVTSYAVNEVERERMARARQKETDDEPRMALACVSVLAVPAEGGHIVVAGVVRGLLRARRGRHLVPYRHAAGPAEPGDHRSTGAGMVHLVAVHQPDAHRLVSLHHRLRSGRCT